MDQIMAVELHNLRYIYGQNAFVLQIENLCVSVGSRVALLGGNGAGKSTLLMALAGILPQVTGELFVLGQLKNKRSKAFGKVGMLLQDPDSQLIAPSLIQDVMLGPLQMGCSEMEARGRSQAMLERLGLGLLSERGPHQLSLGQKKRAALAGLLVHEPELLLLDEPTAGLDPQGRRTLEALLSGLHQEAKTMIVATHDIEFAKRWADEVVLMHEGRILRHMRSLKFFKDRTCLQACGLELAPRESKVRGDLPPLRSKRNLGLRNLGLFMPS